MATEQMTDDEVYALIRRDAEGRSTTMVRHQLVGWQQRLRGGDDVRGVAIRALSDELRDREAHAARLREAARRLP